MGSKVTGHCQSKFSGGINGPDLVFSGQGNCIIRWNRCKCTGVQNIFQKKVTVFQREFNGSRAGRILDLFDQYTAGIFPGNLPAVQSIQTYCYGTGIVIGLDIRNFI